MVGLGEKNFFSPHPHHEIISWSRGEKDDLAPPPPRDKPKLKKSSETQIKTNDLK